MEKIRMLDVQVRILFNTLVAGTQECKTCILINFSFINAIMKSRYPHAKFFNTHFSPIFQRHKLNVR